MLIPVLGAALPDAVSAATVLQSDGTPVHLASIWRDRPALIMFLRHFGCIGCAEGVRALRPALPDFERVDTAVALVGCGAPLFIEPFRERHALLFAPVAVLTDPTLAVHRALGLAYGLWGGFRPKSLWEMARSYAAGNEQGPVQGELRQHAGALLVDQAGAVRFFHRSVSVGDHPPVPALVRAAAAIWLERQAESAAS